MKNNEQDINTNFFLIFLTYMALFNCAVVISPNIDNLVKYLEGATFSGIALLIAVQLTVGIIFTLLYGLYIDKITEKVSRRALFIIANLFVVVCYFFVAFAVNFLMFFIFYCLIPLGSGAFIPIGFSIISDSYPPEERGKKFGAMQFAILMGYGGGIIFGGLWGSYFGAIGWRLAYGFAGLLLLGAIFLYYIRGIEVARGQAEPELCDLENQCYDYKFSLSGIGTVLKKKSVLGVLIAFVLTSIAGTTLGIWQIYFISQKIDSSDAVLFSTLIIILGGIGGLFGSIIGGKLGDNLSKKGKTNGRAVIGFISVIIANALNFLFYLILPFDTSTLLLFILFFFLHWLVYFLITFSGQLSIGNIYAIYSEVCAPENRSIANSINGIAASLGGVIGNLMIFMIIGATNNWNLAVILILALAFVGSFFWLITYHYYPQEAINLRELMKERREEINNLD